MGGEVVGNVHTCGGGGTQARGKLPPLLLPGDACTDNLTFGFKVSVFVVELPVCLSFGFFLRHRQRDPYYRGGSFFFFVSSSSRVFFVGPATRGLSWVSNLNLA